MSNYDIYIIIFIFRFVSDEPSCQYVLSNITGQINVEASSSFFDSITRFGMGTAIIGFIVFVMSYIFVTCLNHAAENQVISIFWIGTRYKNDIIWWNNCHIFLLYLILGVQNSSSVPDIGIETKHWMVWHSSNKRFCFKNGWVSGLYVLRTFFIE